MSLELREFPFELVMARNEVESAFVCREWRVRSFRAGGAG